MRAAASRWRRRSGAFERALRDGEFVVSVLAPTAERKALAGQILREHGGHFINFLGRRTIEVMHP